MLNEASHTIYKIPNATSNTFLNNSKPTGCRRNHLNYGKINVFVIQFSSLNELRDFMRAYSRFFNFVLLYVNVLFLSFVCILRLESG